MQLVKDKQDAVTALYISTRVVVKQAHFPHTSVYYDRHAVQFTYGLSGIASCYCAEDFVFTLRVSSVSASSVCSKAILTTVVWTTITMVVHSSKGTHSIKP